MDTVILDGAVIVQMLPTKTALTFEEYFDAVFAPYVMKQLESVIRVDLVWDVYVSDSLKRSARERKALVSDEKCFRQLNFRLIGKGS